MTFRKKTFEKKNIRRSEIKKKDLKILVESFPTSPWKKGNSKKVFEKNEFDSNLIRMQILFNSK